MTRFDPINTSLAFQSHAGSIEAGVGPGVHMGAGVFQSHAGSIEARLSQSDGGSALWFQSHAGSIEAPLRP